MMTNLTPMRHAVHAGDSHKERIVAALVDCIFLDVLGTRYAEWVRRATQFADIDRGYHVSGDIYNHSSCTRTVYELCILA
jgi:hypothetical protein